MSLLDDASLIVTPNAYKEGKLYSVIPSNGNGDFSVTRATTATRVNAAGLVELVPYNLATWSEMFSNVAWTRVGSNLTANITTAPNGTLTADKLIEDTSTGFHRTFQSITGNVGNVCTYSIYLKAAERTWALVWFDADAAGAYVNLSTGALGTVSSGITASVTSVGDGWYRCSITKTITTGANIAIYTATSNNGASYLGNGTSGVFIWGAQIVQDTSALDYQATETRLNIPRLDYSLGSCPNILLEPQRTNLMLRSEEFDNASWTKADTTITANTTISPSGVQNADTMNVTATTSRVIAPNVLTAGTYTLSVYMKILSGSGTMRFNATIDGVPTSSIFSPTTDWQRFTYTFTAVTSATLIAFRAQTFIGNMAIWGAQLEAGAYGTSYIPTTSASVTRNGDVISRGNIFTNGLVTASGGTWFVDLRNNRALTRDASANGLYLTDATAISFGFRIKSSGSPLRYFVVKVIGGVETSLYLTSANTSKVAIKWNGTTADVFENGVKVVTATAFTNTAMQVLASNVSTPVNINSMALFPTPLTDTQCIAITS
jgi:hypothetical protein